MSMTQKAKFEYRCVPVEVKFDGTIEASETIEAVGVSANSHIMQVNVEVVEAATTGTTLEVGFGDEKSFFSTGLDIAKVGNHNSAKVTSPSVNGFVTITPSAAATAGKIILRVCYFHPSDKIEEISD